ncbi:MAG: hypothetical protein ACR65U_07555 [Methylocystis sp.]|jgi:hypothetical protein
MKKTVTVALLVLACTLSSGGAFAQRGRAPCCQPVAPPWIEYQMWSNAHYLGCDYLRQLYKYGDDVDARRACQGMMFN